MLKKGIKKDQEVLSYTIPINSQSNLVYHILKIVDSV